MNSKNSKISKQILFFLKQKEWTIDRFLSELNYYNIYANKEIVERWLSGRFNFDINAVQAIEMVINQEILTVNELTTSKDIYVKKEETSILALEQSDILKWFDLKEVGDLTTDEGVYIIRTMKEEKIESHSSIVYIGETISLKTAIKRINAGHLSQLTNNRICRFKNKYDCLFFFIKTDKRKEVKRNLLTEFQARYEELPFLNKRKGNDF